MRQGKHLVFVTICAIAVLICGCGKDEGEKSGQPTSSAAGQSSQANAQQPATQPQAPAATQPQAPAATGGAGAAAPSPADLTRMAEQNREVLTKMNQGKDIAAVTAGALKGLLPETLGGMKRTSASAEQNQAMGISMTHAEAQFEGENGASLSLAITDVGNMSASMRLGMAGWTMANYSRETDTGYEKTGTYSGYKGMEEYNTADKYGTIRVFVADRFIIELEGQSVTMDAIKQALDQLDPKKVASLASGS